MSKRDWNWLFRDDGTVLIEALIVVPVFTLFAVGILEFGNMLWQRDQLEIGVRDAARYWSRCASAASGSWPGGACRIETAGNIAFHGDPAGLGGLRVPGWDGEPATELIVEPLSPPSAPVATDLVTVTGSVGYQGSPLFGWLGIEALTIAYSHQERYIGW